MTMNPAQERAETISKERLLTLTPLSNGNGYVARFTTDQGLRGLGQTLLLHGDRSFGIVILPDGRIPNDRETRLIVSPHLEQLEEITATVEVVYSCPVQAGLLAQSDMIHSDLVRLLDVDFSARVACHSVTIQHLSPEAATYGNVEPSNVPEIQAEAIAQALTRLYPDTDHKGEQLRAALCDLRHFADANGLAFPRWDASATKHYNAEKKP